MTKDQSILVKKDNGKVAGGQDLGGFAFKIPPKPDQPIIYL